MVFPTADETANMLAIFAPNESTKIKKISTQKEALRHGTDPDENFTKKTDGRKKETLPQPDLVLTPDDKFLDKNEPTELLVDIGDEDLIMTEDEAIIEVPAIPLYFPTSFALVKPYVKGFEMSNLDAPLLKNVVIDNNWQPNNKKGES
jgi:hypothetical protein